jgi:hypothetical protein
MSSALKTESNDVTFIQAERFVARVISASEAISSSMFLGNHHAVIDGRQQGKAVLGSNSLVSATFAYSSLPPGR